MPQLLYSGPLLTPGSPGAAPSSTATSWIPAGACQGQSPSPMAVNSPDLWGQCAQDTQGYGTPAKRPGSLLPPPVLAEVSDQDAVSVQKRHYLDSLAEQVRLGEEMLKQQEDQQVQYIKDAAEAEKHHMAHQIDERVKQQEMQLSQKYAQQHLALKQEYHRQKQLLERQANDVAMETQRRKAQQLRARQAPLSPRSPAPLSPVGSASCASGPLVMAPPLLDMSALEVHNLHANFAAPGGLPGAPLPPPHPLGPPLHHVAPPMGAPMRGPTVPAVVLPPGGHPMGGPHLGQPLMPPGGAWMPMAHARPPGGAEVGTPPMGPPMLPPGGAWPPMGAPMPRPGDPPVQHMF